MKKVYQIFSIRYQNKTDNPNTSFLKLRPFWEWVSVENSNEHKAIPRSFLTEEEAEHFLSDQIKIKPQMNCNFTIIPIYTK